MSTQSKRIVVGLVVGSLVMVGYGVWALVGSTPAPGDLRGWARALLAAVAIGVVGVVVGQIRFHVGMNDAIARQRLSGRPGPGRPAPLEDERDKLIARRSGPIGATVSGLGVTGLLTLLALGGAPVVGLHLLVGCCAVGGLAEGVAQIVFYERGVSHG
ncbi:MAG: hypothetical protein LBJ44_03935 [Propionibacteriaceae bacterium]|jgi:hypothetical protein|nr:hypothetical protein [Propionibacteriaceae bacterium]